MPTSNRCMAGLLLGYNKDIMDVLIFDDEVDLCLLLSEISRKHYLTVACTYNSEDCFTKMKTLPSLLFLDNNLPDGSGLLMIRALREISPRTKIVLITADVNPAVGRLARMRGADYFLPKPFSLKTVEHIFSEI